MPNMNSKISNHNKKLLESKEEEPKCNCRNKAECPLPGRCLTDKVIYRATVTTNSEIQTYVGLTAGEFKTRYRKHTSDFNNPNGKNSTTLSSYIWKQKENNNDYQIKFEIVGRAAPFSAVSGRCNLCIALKFKIIFNPKKASLNSRHELFSACRHKWTHLLVKKKRERRPRGR